MSSLQIGLIGDRNDSVVAHRAIPLTLEMAAAACDVAIDVSWIGTDQIGDGAVLSDLDGVWCVPASPYRDMDGALTAIRIAREQKIPFLGTCGGFQHAVIEYARNVVGWTDAEHAETASQAQRQVIVPLLCSLVEVADTVHLVEGSRLARAYGETRIVEGYHCSYGLSSDFRHAIADTSLRVSAVDDSDDIRGMELDDHPFFVATLFQHERNVFQDRLSPPARAFVEAIVHTR